MNANESRAGIPGVGDPAPLFVTPSLTNERYHFHSAAGRYLVLCFFCSARQAHVQALLRDVHQRQDVFDDQRAAFFGVSIDPEDVSNYRLQQQIPGIRFLLDHDLAVSRLYGLVADNVYTCITLILDERMRVFAQLPITADTSQHVNEIVGVLAGAPAPGTANGVQIPAPVLVIPRVFEPALCQQLITYYQQGGATESGFMRDIGDKTVGVYDHARKRRFDKTIDDEELRQACMARVHRRIVPEIQRAFQFHANRIERHIVACYDGELEAHFKPHRDNTTRGTAHRRFAVSLVLNEGEFAGGQLRFPEYGPQTYSPPAGGAVVFSCSLLHEATVVTNGKRYCYLPFLYDDAAAQVRQANNDALK